MTEAITFDTYKFVKNLTQHGFTEDQAEVLANEQIDLLNNNLATKVDIAELKVELLKWMIGAIIAQTGLLTNH